MPDRPRFTAWITKYALSTGISEKLVEQCTNVSDSMVAEINDTWHQNAFHGEGKDWHRTREGAVKRANEMRIKKIASLKKQIVKLESQAFK